MRILNAFFSEMIPLKLFLLFLCTASWSLYQALMLVGSTWTHLLKRTVRCFRNFFFLSGVHRRSRLACCLFVSCFSYGYRHLLWRDLLESVFRWIWIHGQRVFCLGLIQNFTEVRFPFLHRYSADSVWGSGSGLGVTFPWRLLEAALLRFEFVLHVSFWAKHCILCREKHRFGDPLGRWYLLFYEVLPVCLFFLAAYHCESMFLLSSLLPLYCHFLYSIVQFFGVYLACYRSVFSTIFLGSAVLIFLDDHLMLSTFLYVLVFPRRSALLLEGVSWWGSGFEFGIQHNVSEVI